MVNFLQELKKSRDERKALLEKQLKSTTKTTYQNEEEGFWFPQLDKAKNGYAVIRFLPAGNNEESPFVQLFEYNFLAPGGWYIEKSRQTLDRDEADPCAEFLSVLWQTNKDEARKYPRKKYFVSNILVVDDPAKPENNGKVFKYKYGKQVMDKIFSAYSPKIKSKKSFNPFDLWEAANFNLVIKEKDRFVTYEDSEFDTELTAIGTDKEIEKIIEQCASLLELVSPDKFKSYEALKKRLDRVFGVKSDVEAKVGESKPQPSPGKSKAPSKKIEEEEESVELAQLLKDVNLDDDDNPFKD